MLIVLAGVIYFFEEEEVKSLFEAFRHNFKKSTVIFDYSSVRGMEIANRKVIAEGGMDRDAYLKWGIDNIRELEKWNSGITVNENMKMFKEHRKKYPAGKRIGMWISDALSVMSLAEIIIQ